MTTLQEKINIVSGLLPKLASIAYNELHDSTVMCNFTDVELDALVSLHKAGAMNHLEKWMPYLEAEISKRKSEYRNNQIDNLLDGNNTN